jgi:hypothetical protein
MASPFSIPAIGGISDPEEVRVVLFVNGQFVHVPLKQLLKELDADNLVSGSINAALLANTDLDADNLASGTVPNERVSATLTADKAYRRGNILGTVSQSSGVPTGALIERGSNSNGEYVRFADGTQICTKTVSNLGPIDTAHGSLFVSAQIALGNWPAAFTAAPVRSVTGQGVTNAVMIFGDTAPSTTSAGGIFLARGNTSAATNFGVGVMGVGRWF